MSGSKTEARDKGGNMVVGIGGFGFGEDVDGGPGGRSDRGGRGGGRDGDYKGQLIKWGGYCSNHNLMERA